MLTIKAFLTGIVGVSLCMANINGIVTDTGTAPLSGAVVQLEKGGQTATTGTDGRFTLTVSTAVLSGKNIPLPNSLSAGIAGNLLKLTIAQRSAVEVSIFDLNGKLLSTVCQAMDAGSHCIALPQHGAGIYLYKVKAGNNEFVLKGNAVGVTTFGSSQGSSSQSLKKQAKVTAAINDIIAATKTGYLNYQCVQYNFDTTGIVIKMIVSAGTVTDTDGNVYQTVRIGNQAWTAENLRVARYNDGTAITKEPDSTAWDNMYKNNLTTPAYCYYKNTINADTIKKWGALYNWYAVDTKKLAPAGWHVPSDAEWDTLQYYLIANGFTWDGTTDTSGNRKIAKSLAAKTTWTTNATMGAIGNDLTMNNRSGFSALPGGRRERDGTFSLQSYSGQWWSATERFGTYSRSLFYGSDVLYREYTTGCGFSVRLVRDN